ncbi:glycosyltransferase family 2 protein [Mediterraneibacter gnavus]|jgi:glycosyltransferase involved in cell wall biosynthesis|uniref:glycosyltransferase family 2 protein n=1 Tax=Mediterraneibacter gnavus TaxID=33038 RepID=UPI0036D42A68
MKLSIIVPIYKVEKFLPKCIDSILEQTYSEFELILVDDGSPDYCPQICDEYAQKDNRIIVIHQKNSGVSVARNIGLKKASGKYIGFVDPDDFVAPEMFEKMVQVMDDSNVELVVCGYDYYNEEYQIEEKRKYKNAPNEKINQKELMKRMSDMPPTIRHGVVNKLFKANLLGDRKFPEKLHSSEDVFFLNDYIKVVHEVVVIHEPLYKNLIRSGSATHGGLSIESLADSFRAHYQMYQDIISYYPELKNHSQAFLLDVCTLKYDEAKRKLENLPEEEKKKVQKRLKEMKKFIKKNARKAMFNKEIYWKTRIYYLIF